MHVVLLGQVIIRQVRTSGGEGNLEHSSLASVTWWPMAVNWRHSSSLRWMPKPQETEHYRVKWNRIIMFITNK